MPLTEIELCHFPFSPFHPPALPRNPPSHPSLKPIASLSLNINVAQTYMNTTGKVDLVVRMYVASGLTFCAGQSIRGLIPGRSTFCFPWQ